MNPKSKELYLENCYKEKFRYQCILELKEFLKTRYHYKSVIEITKDAEDLYQETFIEVSHQFDNGKLNRPVGKGWFTKTAKIVWWSRVPRKERKKTQVSLEHENIIELPHNDERIEDFEMGDFMAEFSKRLSKTEKKAFIFLDKALGVESIACEIGVKESTLKRKIIFSIRKKFREFKKEYLSEKPGGS